MSFHPLLLSFRRLTEIVVLPLQKTIPDVAQLELGDFESSALNRAVRRTLGLRLPQSFVGRYTQLRINTQKLTATLEGPDFYQDIEVWWPWSETESIYFVRGEDY
jgi:hypothetical protein